jgi:hypothetical protein
MRRYYFDYRVEVKTGGIAAGSVKAIHEKNAKSCLKLKFPGCKILECEPVMVPTNGLRIGKHAKDYEGMKYEEI